MEKQECSDSARQDVQSKRSKRILFLVVAAVLAINAVILIQVVVQPEPKYKGLTVSRWIQNSKQGKVDREVINALGPEAAPYVVQFLTERKSRLDKLKQSLWPRLPNSLQRRLVVLRPTPIDEKLRGAALDWLTQLGTGAKEVVPQLVEIALEGVDQHTRVFGIVALGKVGLESPEALSALIRLLKDPDLMIQEYAAPAVGRFGANAGSAIPAFMQYVNRPPQPITFSASGIQIHLAQLEQRLALQRQFGQPMSLSALTEVGPEAGEAVPRITASLPSEFGFEILAQIGSGAIAAVPDLVKHLTHQNIRYRLLSMEALTKIGPPAQQALASLKDLQKDEVDVVRILAAVAIGKIEGDFKPAVPVLLEELRIPEHGRIENWNMRLTHPTWPFRISHRLVGRQAAAWFLGEIGPAANEALPALREFLTSRNEVRRIIAARSMWMISHSVEEVLVTVLEALKDGNKEVDFPFHVAIQTLAEMGSSARSASPVLAQFINQKTNRWIARREVLNLLQKLDPEAAARVSLR